MKYILCLFLFSILGCKPDLSSGEEYFISKVDIKSGLFAYYDLKGNKVSKDFQAIFTDTIYDYGIVADNGIFLIDKKGSHVYEVFTYDNGPDYVVDGLQRIIKNGKIGFGDPLTGKIIIEPKYDCAYPFENGKAKVSTNCKTISDGEHSGWESDKWKLIDIKGNEIQN